METSINIADASESVCVGERVFTVCYFSWFLALLARGQKGLCRGDLSVVRACVRPCVRKQFLVNTIQSSLLIVSQLNLYSS